MKKCLLGIAISITVASHGQVMVNSYDSSHVPLTGIFKGSKKVNETIIAPLDSGKPISRNLPNGLLKFA